jgi:hypothetical protein
MVYCTKCGGNIDKNWKHCPSCGQVVAKQTASIAKSTKPPKPTMISKDAIPVVNGIPTYSTKKRIPQSRSLTLEENYSNKKFNKLLAVFFSILGILVLVAVVQSNNTSDLLEPESISASPVVRLASDVPWIDPVGSQSQYPPGIDDAGEFYGALNDFQSIKCQRNSKARGIDSIPESLWSINGYPIYANRYPKEFFWGTSSEKLKVGLASMASGLAQVENTVKYLNSKSRSADFKTWDKSFKKWASIACQEPELPEVEAYKVLMDFFYNYEMFFNWTREVFDQSDEESEAFAESLKPQCTEYPSTNPRYSIVKCTNLP